MAGLGIGLCRLALPILGVGLMGDCFQPADQCAAYDLSKVTQARVGLAILVGNTALGIFAIFAGRRRVPFLLLLLPPRRRS